MKAGFVTDIHEDITNLDYAIRVLQDNDCDEIYCLGDIVGFVLPFYKNISSRDADACVKTVMQHSSHVVIGNHDLFAIKKVPVHTAGFEYGENWYALDYDTRYRRSRNHIWLYEDSDIPCTLSRESIDYLRSRSETAVVTSDEYSFFLSHFCYPDFSGSCIHFPTEAFHLKNHFAFIESKGCLLSFSGHGHPEGCLVGDQDRIHSLGFGIHNIKKTPQWIVAPCIARTSRKNGVLIFDTEKMQLHIIPLLR